MVSGHAAVQGVCQNLRDGGTDGDDAELGVRVVVEDVHDAGGGGGGCFTSQFKSNKVLLTNSKNCTCAIIIA